MRRFAAAVVVAGATVWSSLLPALSQGQPAPDLAAVNQRIDALQKQLDDLKAARGAQATAEGTADLQKQLDALKASINKAATPGYGKLVVDGNAQIWLGASSTPDPPILAPAAGKPVDTTNRPFTGYFKTGEFGARLRRMQVDLTDQLDPKWTVHFMSDFARTSSTHTGENGAPNELAYLQEVYAQYNFSSVNSILIGQLKLPLNETSTQSNDHFPTLEQPLFVVGQRNGAAAALPAADKSIVLFNVPQWGNIRDVGVQYRRTTPDYTLQGAITEGAGDYQNSTQIDSGKQLTGQAFWRPRFIKDLQIGVAGSGGSGFLARTPAVAASVSAGTGVTVTTPTGTSTIIPAVSNAAVAAGPNVYLQRVRSGGSVVYKPGRFFFESEYMGGSDGIGIVPGAGTTPATTVNAHRHGEYGIVGYDLDKYKSGDGNQVVAQVDYWDPGAGEPRQTNYTLGLNHDMAKGHERIQVNYVHEHYDAQSSWAPLNSDSDGLYVAVLTNW